MNKPYPRSRALAMAALAASFPAMAQVEPEASVAAPVAEQTAPPTAPETTATIPVDAAQENEAAPTDARAASRSRLIEEVVVTAQKREESLQDVPISVVAFTAESLDSRGAFDTKALPRITPAMSITEFGGFSFIYIRGIGSDAFVPSADPSVTTYVDGIFVPTSQGLTTDFGGIERVEVLKGPQGTLFGRNSTGGAINVVTKNPGQTFEGNLSGTIGNYDERRLKAYVNVPITDTLAVALDGVYKDYDSQYTHVSRKLVGQSNKEGRAKLHWQPDDTVGLTLAYNYSKQKSVGSSVAKNIQPGSLFNIAVGGPQEDNYVIEADFDALTVGHSEVLSGTFEWNLPWFDFKTIVADQRLDQEYTSIDFDATYLPLVNFETYGQFTDATSVEVQFLSREGGWLSEGFQWVVGGYYLDGEGGFPEIYLRPASGILDFALNQAQVPDEFRDVLTPLLDPLANVAEVNLLSRGAVGTESLSQFAQGTWYATDKLEFTLGGRYTSEKRFLTYADTSAFLPDPDTHRGPGGTPSGTVIPILKFGLPSRKDTNFSTRAAISVIPVENQRYYLSYATGYKSATYNVINIYLPADEVKPEEVSSYELGMKSRFFDGALQINAAAFWNDIKDKQTVFVSLLAGGAIELLNADKATVKGAEFDLILLPLPNANPGLVVTANGAYLRAKYDSFKNGHAYSEVGGVYQASADHSGNRIERTPKLSGGIGISQTIGLNDSSDLELSTDVYYSGDYYFTPQNNDDLKQGSFSLLNANISYIYHPWDIRLTAFGKNLLNEDYKVGMYQTDFGILNTRAYQRQYGLTVQWRF